MDRLINFEKMGFYDASDFNRKKKTTLRETALYEIELDMTEAGTSFINGVGYPHKIGNIFVCRPGLKRQSVQPYQCHFIHFECLSSEFEEKYLKNLPVYMFTDNAERFRTLIDRIVECVATDGRNNELYATTAFLDLICELNRLSEQQMSEGKGSKKLYRNIHEAQNYVLNHYGEKILLEKLAEEAHLSANYFLSAFKKTVGKTPNKYITEVRLGEAKKRLVNTRLSMEEIAEQCGFETQAYMCYVFKKELNISPKSYRDLYKIVL